MSHTDSPTSHTTAITTTVPLPPAGEALTLPQSSPADAPRSPPADECDLSWARDLVTPALREAVERLPGPERRLVGYHRGWWQQDGRPVPEQPSSTGRGVGDAVGRGGGKAVRPALVLLGALAVGGSVEAAVPAAVAVELVHDFSLLHDDVMDKDTLRRHRPAAWTVFGTPAAVLAGDSLLVSAVDVLLRSAVERGADGAAAVAELTQALRELMRGQSEDITFESRTGVSVAEYLAMAEGKTGSLMACACALGAVLGGASPQRITRLRNFGRHLGMAFQCVDDIIGIWGTSERSGKPVGADVAARKKTLPVAAALTDTGPTGRTLVELYSRQDPLSEAEVALAIELVGRAGGRARAEQEAARQRAAALSELALAALPLEPRRHLQNIADMMTRRDH